MRIRKSINPNFEKLFYEENQTEISADDDHFFLGDKNLNIYVEDGHIFALKPVLPFLKWPMISSPTGLTIDSEGFVWSKDSTCIFDQFLRPTYSL